MYYICGLFSKDINKPFFTADEFTFIRNKYFTYFNTYRTRFINLGYIQYIKRLTSYNGIRFNKDIYQITSKGITRAKEIINLKLRTFPEEFNHMVSIWERLYKKYYKSLQS